MMPKHLKMLNQKMLILIILSLSLIGAVFLYMHHVVQAFDQVFGGAIYIEQLPIEGLTREEAYVAVEAYLEKQLQNQFITLTQKDRTLTIPLSELNPAYPIEETLSEAFKEGHEASWLDRYKLAQKPNTTPKYFEIEAIYRVSEISEVLKHYTEHFYIAPIDATIIREHRKFIITPEQSGQTLDIDSTSKKIYEVLNHTENTVEVVLKEVPAKTTREGLQQIQSPIASFSTAYNNNDENRNRNLSIAAKKINKVLAPEEIFSLGNQIEPISESAGYRTSKVIINGKLEEGIGGGVCQIASTLYNAVLLTNLDIIGRVNHSLPVAYVPLGRDATYASGAIDFRFQNNSKYPVFIESYCENNRVYVNIFSHSSLKPTYDEIKFSSEVIEVKAPPPAEYVKDPELEMGRMITEITPLEGKTVKLYKLYYQDGTLVNKELVDTSYYKERGEVIRIGTKPLEMKYQEK